MGDKKELQEAFEKHLIANGKYPKEAIYRNWEVASNGSTITLDIAIVINDIVIQAFQLFDDKTEGESAPTKTFTQTIDAVEVENKALTAICDSTDKDWEIKSSNDNSRNKSKCFMLFSTVGKKYFDEAEKIIREKRLLPIASVLKDKCTRICCVCTIYLILYILFFLGDSNGLCNCQLPLSWELLVFIAIILLFSILPYILPFVSAIKIGNVEINLAREAFKNMITEKV